MGLEINENHSKNLFVLSLQIIWFLTFVPRSNFSSKNSSGVLSLLGAPGRGSVPSEVLAWGGSLFLSAVGGEFCTS